MAENLEGKHRKKKKNPRKINRLQNKLPHGKLKIE
jgi:hypothetical protein